MKIFRFFKILSLMIRFGIYEFIQITNSFKAIKYFLSLIFFWRKLKEKRGIRLRKFLENLGPIFVKFGQVLSTRRDIIPIDIADQLALLQDKVPPIAAGEVRKVLSENYEISTEKIFEKFDFTALASASVAQVHLAILKDGKEVAVKILRPNIEVVIKKDLALMKTIAYFFEKFIKDGKRFKPIEIVEEFSKHLYGELDLIREASSANQIKRNFKNSRHLLVPEIYWEYTTKNILIMEKMSGHSISDIQNLKDMNIDLKKLAKNGVEIFFTQVFRDGFFHADMHPGNIKVSKNGTYIALDFGIVGTLNDIDKNYLARNFIAFFRRDYKDVAQAHVDAGWIPDSTKVNEFEAEIRSVCEPIFDRPLKEISFGKLLLRLFQTSRDFNINIQPQLIMLQKTLLNVEGLGRQLDPDLDLWKTAKPFLEKWMSEQIGARGFLKRLKKEIPVISKDLPLLPSLLINKLRYDSNEKNEILLAKIVEQEKRNQKRINLIIFIQIILFSIIFYKLL